MVKRAIIATALAIVGLVLVELANPWPACRYGAGWWRCVQFELAAQHAAERAARLDRLGHHAP